LRETTNEDISFDQKIRHEKFEDGQAVVLGQYGQSELVGMDEIFDQSA